MDIRRLSSHYCDHIPTTSEYSDLNRFCQLAFVFLMRCLRWTGQVAANRLSDHASTRINVLYVCCVYVCWVQSRLVVAISVLSTFHIAVILCQSRLRVYSVSHCGVNIRVRTPRDFRLFAASIYSAGAISISSSTAAAAVYPSICCPALHSLYTKRHQKRRNLNTRTYQQERH
jgi:hypothetical protein